MNDPDRPLILRSSRSVL